MTRSSMRVLAIGVLLAATPAQAAQSGSSPFAGMQGGWICEGYFIKSKKPIASDLQFKLDPIHGQLRKLHADRAPGTYRSEKIWTAPSKDGSTRAVIVSADGMRWYESTGWQGDRLAWKRVAGRNETAEEFVYLRKPDRRLEYPWWIECDGGELSMGDILTSKHSAGRPSG